MVLFWTDWVKNYEPDDFRVNQQKKVISNSLRYSRKKRAWFRCVQYDDGTTDMAEAIKLKHLNPDDYESDKEEDVVDTQPFSMFIEFTGNKEGE